MKLSISWIFDYIDADWKKINIKDLVQKFNKTTAEIESFKKINIELENLFLAKVSNLESENVILYCQELNKEIELPKKIKIKEDQLYLIKKQNNNFYWANSIDLGAEKEMQLPNLYLNEKFLSGDWKNSFEHEDYILEVDNKSVTNRPDLWGHRGYAREIAAILDLDFLPLQSFLIKKNILNFDFEFNKSEENPFNIKIENKDLCKRFAAFYIKEINYKPSSLMIASRLSKIDSKVINSVVDATNYVMFDLSQPMHAFDANKIKSKNINIQLASSEKKLTLLDTDNIELSSMDLIISDENEPIVLAGIMGGKNTEVDDNTNSLLIESACFDPTTIRKSSIVHKKRTEASARFEKSLDPNQNIIAIERFLKILELSDFNYIDSKNIFSLGDYAQEKKININHTFIEKKLGTKIDENFVKEKLEKLEFKVKYSKDINNVEYEIKVPTFRGTKDITIPEDIVEEVGRFYGYDNIPFVLPLRQMKPTNFTYISKEKKIKQLMSFACNMHEVQNYPFYDEEFLKEINWFPANAISVINPISENYRRLVTSLIPHLLKNIKQNLNRERFNLFELNRVWKILNDSYIEHKSLAGLLFDQKISKGNNIFFEGKSFLEKLFDLLKIKVNWVKSEISALPTWYSHYETANLICDNFNIGFAGNISHSFLSEYNNSNIFIFELNSDFLINHLSKDIKFKQLPKYQSIWFDISFFIPIDKTVDQIINIVKESDKRIYRIELKDIFEKQDQKSITIRYYFVDETKNMSKEDIDYIQMIVTDNIIKIGAQLR